MWHEVEIEPIGKIRQYRRTSKRLVFGVALMALDVIACAVSYAILYQFIK